MNNVTDWQGGENEPVGYREGSVEFKINTSQHPGNKTGIILEKQRGLSFSAGLRIRFRKNPTKVGSGSDPDSEAQLHFEKLYFSSGLIFLFLILIKLFYNIGVHGSGSSELKPK